MVDVARQTAARIGPVVETAILDASEEGVEVRLVDQEGVVLRPEGTLDIGKVLRDAVVQFDDLEVAEPEMAGALFRAMKRKISAAVRTGGGLPLREEFARTDLMA